MDNTLLYMGILWGVGTVLLLQRLINSYRDKKSWKAFQEAQSRRNRKEREERKL